jgi:hypothetical protein
MLGTRPGTRRLGPGGIRIALEFKFSGVRAGCPSPRAPGLAPACRAIVRLPVSPVCAAVASRDRKLSARKLSIFIICRLDLEQRTFHLTRDLSLPLESLEAIWHGTKVTESPLI